jgi:hypothetical protein
MLLSSRNFSSWQTSAKRSPITSRIGLQAGSYWPIQTAARLVKAGVPTIGFNLLYVLVIVRLARRELVWINVTACPTAEWIARQITEAFPWNEVPRYLIRNRDGIFGVAVTRRLRAMGIRDKPISAGSPWQNSFAERLIGTIRRECVDHIVVLGEAHLRRILREYAHYYNTARTHRSLDQDAPVGGLHHQYARIWVFGTHRALTSAARLFFLLFALAERHGERRQPFCKFIAAGQRQPAAAPFRENQFLQTELRRRRRAACTTQVAFSGEHSAFKRLL